MKGWELLMEEQKRIEKYRCKGRILFDEYMAESKMLMERRRHYKKLDEGVREERQLRENYNKKQDMLREEYKDILHLIKRS